MKLETLTIILSLCYLGILFIVAWLFKFSIDVILKRYPKSINKSNLSNNKPSKYKRV